MIKDYKLWGWGNNVGVGTFGAQHIGVAGVAKRAPDNHPVSVANEMLCCELGRAIRLPIPPGIIVRRESIPHFVSLNFFSGEQLPPADPEAIARDVPYLACATILFDLWILNFDRHDENLHFDEATKQLALFDHGLALMPGTEGRTRIETHSAALDTYLLKRHCLTASVLSMDGFAVAYGRLQTVPNFYIEEALRDVIPLGLKSDDAFPCWEFLVNRRETLLDIIAANRDLFTSVLEPLPAPDSQAEG